MDDALVQLGRDVVNDGRLQALRETLGLTRNAIADLLYTTPTTYASWESDKPVRMWPQTAERVGRFFTHASAQLVSLREHDIKIDELMPLFQAASKIGVPQELLLKRYREGLFHAEDLGMLGLWVYRDEIEQVAGTL